LRHFFRRPRTTLSLATAKVVAECIGEPIRATIRLGFFIPHNVNRECGSLRDWSSRLPVEIFGGAIGFGGKSATHGAQ
jgi:hypothetical protein